ncbi:hypothetical protein EMPS_03592 [Entomortierella parvispora]|uniref:F-box domain-containing protein n=1 Tax=Entomortierella parvispora TaxID=205924 RepID=A0A9P3LUQ8_9FUNG|nr:hypothetical protein EMPS_03592 [Entomortierella parvispora]
MTNSSWDLLWPEVVSFICIYLSKEDKLNCKLVSRTWRSVWEQQLTRERVQTVVEHTVQQEPSPVLSFALVPAPRITSWNYLPPEITPTIATYLGHASIARCCRVSLQWNGMWTRELWSDVRLYSPVQCRRFLRASSQLAFQASLDQLRSFESSQGVVHGQMLLSGRTERAMQKLKSVHLAFPRVQPLVSSELDTILEVVRRAGGLRHLSLSGVGRLHPAMASDPRLSCALFWIQSRALQSLFVDFDVVNWSANVQHWMFSVHDSVPVLPSLGHFSVSGLVAEELLVAFLQRCPNLQTLEIHRNLAWSVAPTRMSSIVSTQLKSLKELCYDVPAVTDEIAGLFLEGVMLQHLSLSPSGTIGGRTRSFLLSGAPMLESLVVEGVSGFDGEFLQDFLVAAENLKMLSGLTFSRPLVQEFDLSIAAHHIRYQPMDFGGLFDPIVESAVVAQGTGETIQASDGQAAPVKSEAAAPLNSDVGAPSSWACLELESLAINIGGIPRSDLVGWTTRLRSGSTVVSALVSHEEDDATDEIQRIYGQLGQLTSLKELCLGHGPRSKESPITRMPGRNRAISSAAPQPEQLQCISLSLASGLDELAGLKKLRSLDVSNTAHKIGVAELEWMRENWPVLRTIIGLYDRVGVSVPDKWQGEILHNVQEWMAQHPHGIGSAFPRLL